MDFVINTQFVYNREIIRILVDERFITWFEAAAVANILNYKNFENTCFRKRDKITVDGQVYINKKAIDSLCDGSEIYSDFDHWIINDVLPSVRIYRENFM